MSENIQEKFLTHLRQYGLLATLRKSVSWFSRKLLSLLGMEGVGAIEKRRRELSNSITKLFDATVRYGPFRGLKLTAESWWGSSDRAAMLLGLYEREVLDALQNIPSSYSTFIDLGAADGYYGVGVLVNDLFKKSYCFEISKKGQEVIRKNAALNKVADRLIIKGMARKDFYREIQANEIDTAVVLIDIEGEEFGLLDDSVFRALSKSIIFIEIHDWVDDAEQKISQLKNRAQLTHSIEVFSTGIRDLSAFPELKMYSDSDRWLICSEGRPRLMSWYRLDPIRQAI
jgi:hypothetical protein